MQRLVNEIQITTAYNMSGLNVAPFFTKMRLTPELN